MREIYQELIEKIKKAETGVLLLYQISGKQAGMVEELQIQIDTCGEIVGDKRKEILLDGQPDTKEIAGKKYWIEPYYKRERIIILGGGHVAIPLVKMAKMLDFYVVLLDDRKEFANEERFPEADEVFCNSFVEGIRQIKPGKSDYCIVITRGHAQDEACIRELLQHEESVYTGMIGSKKRTKFLLDRLAEEGKDQDRLHRICTPIGLAIGAKTPAEIDIAILAEMIQRKRLESQGMKEVDRSDNNLQVVEVLAAEKKECVIAVIMEAEGSAPRRAGAKMLLYKDGSIVGTIGGGSVEQSIIQKGLSLIGTGRYEIVETVLDGKDAMAEGMICGGRMKILLESL